MCMFDCSHGCAHVARDGDVSTLKEVVESGESGELRQEDSVQLAARGMGSDAVSPALYVAAWLVQAPHGCLGVEDDGREINAVSQEEGAVKGAAFRRGRR